jgi:integrase
MTQALRLRHRSLSTERSYCTWLRQFKDFIQAKSPREITSLDLKDFLSHLAVERKVSVSTQRQALNGLIFFCRHILNLDLENVLDAVSAQRRRRLPLVMTQQEIEQVLDRMTGIYRHMPMLVYGCGLRLNESLSLRIKDFDFERGTLTVRAGKVDKDRTTVFPDRLRDDLVHHINTVRKVHDQDRQQNLSGVFLPGALDKKYPNAGKEWAWFWLFPLRVNARME